MQHNRRPPTSVEFAIFQQLLNHTFPGADELRSAFENVRVEELDNNGSIRIHPGHDVAVGGLESAVPVEGEAVDSDGVSVHVLLHILPDDSLELEIYKENGAAIESPEVLRSMEVYALPRAPDL